MSFNAKNLTYGRSCALRDDILGILTKYLDSNEPMFLRRLRGEYQEDNTRHERPLARPRKQISDEDEAPTYVQEISHDTISKAEFDALVKGVEVEKQESDLLISPATPNDDLERPLETLDKNCHDQASSKQQMAGIGGNARRKLAKIVREDDREEGSQVKVHRLVDEKKPNQKKGKKIKLSFSEE